MDLQLTHGPDGPSILVPATESRVVRDLLRRRGVVCTIREGVVPADGAVPGLDELQLGADYDLAKVEEALDRWNQTGRAAWRKSAGPGG
jgi:hypothetical protein